MSVHPARRAAFVRRLLAWYREQARDLPWRRTRDPYCVWVSEVMLQQTRVETAIPYYERWLAEFPNLERLAAAAPADVLRLWEGLGYYSRARNLQRAAQIIVSEPGGRIPRSAEALQRLPGIGRYTAGAIASICFGARVPALDGNVKRVLARLFDLELDIRSAAGERELWALAGQLVPEENPGDLNQALMELGAVVCTPASPVCTRCPLRRLCAARKLGVQHLRPVAARKPATPHYREAAAIIRRRGPVLLVQRPPNGLLGGLWRFPGGRLQPGETDADCLRRALHEELGLPVEVGRSIRTIRHGYTHFKVTVHVHECTLVAGAKPTDGQADARWVKPGQLPDFPMGKVDREIARRVTNPP